MVLLKDKTSVLLLNLVVAAINMLNIAGDKGVANSAGNQVRKVDVHDCFSQCAVPFL